MELSALERLKNQCIMFLFNFDWFFLIVAGTCNKDIHKNLDEWILVYLRNILTTLPSGSQVSDRCPWGYLFKDLPKCICRYSMLLLIWACLYTRFIKQ